MLGLLINYAGVLYHLFAKLADKKFRNRNPTEEEWEVAETVYDTLSYPCKVVVKAQSRGHWLQSDGIHRLVDVYNTYRGICEELHDFEDETVMETDDVHLKADLRPDSLQLKTVAYDATTE